MTDAVQYWCYINNSKEFEYIENLPKVSYGDSHLEHPSEFPIIFNLDLRGLTSTHFWVFDSASSFSLRLEAYPELSFEEMKAQLFIYQLTL